MRKFVDGVIRWRWVIVVLIPLLTFALSSQLKYLGFEGSYRIWFGETSTILKNYDDFRSIFGNDDAITITFKDEKGLFNKDDLGVIDRITQKLWQTPYIARVDSLTNYQYVHTDEAYPDDVLVEDFVLDYATLGDDALRKKAEIIQQEDQVIGRIISKDLTTTMIVGRLTPKAGDDPQVSFKVRDAVLKILAPEEQKYGIKFYLNGGPALNTSFVEIAQHDGGIFTPAIILVAMLLLWIIFRRFSAMMMSISVVIFTFLIVLAVQVLLGYKLNNFTANMPVFVIAIGIADAMHLLWVYLIARRQGQSNREAIHYSVSKNFLAILMTSLTTAVGFASLGISPVVPIQTLGIATANASLLAFAITIVFVPAVLAIVNPKVKEKEVARHEQSQFIRRYVDFIMRHDKKIVISVSTLFVILFLGVFKVEVDSNTIRFFDEDVPMRKAVEFTQDNLTGPMAYEIIVDSKVKNGIKTPEFMRAVEQFYTDYQAKFPDVRHMSSLLDVVKKFNEVMDHNKSVPDNKNLIAQYLLLYSLSLPQGMEINDKMDVNEQLLRVTTSNNIVDTSKDLEMIDYAIHWWDKTPYSATVNGQTAMFAYMQHDITNTLIQSITLAVVIVSLMMLVIFRNLKMLPLFVIPNILPIALVVGIMGWLGITIDMGVAIAGAIIIGVAVDDTIHFMVKYLEARKRGDSMRDSLEYVMHYSGSAIIFTTLVLSLAFAVFMLSKFSPNYHFSVVTVSALIIALIADLLLLPAFLAWRDNKKRSELA